MSKGFVTDLGFPFDFETSTEKLDSKSRALGLNWFFIFACCFYQVSLYNQVCRGGAAVLTKILINIPTNFCNRSELTKSKRNCDFDVLPFPDNSVFPRNQVHFTKKTSLEKALHMDFAHKKRQFCVYSYPFSFRIVYTIDEEFSQKSSSHAHCMASYSYITAYDHTCD